VFSYLAGLCVLTGILFGWRPALTISLSWTERVLEGGWPRFERGLADQVFIRFNAW